MSDSDPTPQCVDALYEQLAVERAERARAALEGEQIVERLFVQSAGALEDAAGTLLHASSAFVALQGRWPALFAEQARALLTLAARFEAAADLSRAREAGRDRGEEDQR